MDQLRISCTGKFPIFLLHHDEFPIVTLINGPMNTIIRVIRIFFFPPFLPLTG